MNKLKLKELTDTYVVYLFQPEGKGDWGEVRMNFADTEAQPVLFPHPGVLGVLYMNKALYAVEMRVMERDFPEAFTQAWY